MDQSLEPKEDWTNKSGKLDNWNKTNQKLERHKWETLYSPCLSYPSNCWANARAIKKADYVGPSRRRPGGLCWGHNEGGQCQGHHEDGLCWTIKNAVYKGNIYVECGLCQGHHGGSQCQGHHGGSRDGENDYLYSISLNYLAQKQSIISATALRKTNYI